MIKMLAVNHAFFNTTGLEQIQDVLGKTDFDLWPEMLAKNTVPMMPKSSPPASRS